MARRLVIFLGHAAALALFAPAAVTSAQASHGTEQQARAMLDKAVVAMKADTRNALASRKA